jgi:hypothetical protein
MARHLRDVSDRTPAYTPEIARQQLFDSPLAVRYDLTFYTLRLSRLHVARWTDPLGGRHEVSYMFLEHLMTALEREFSQEEYTSAPKLTVYPPRTGP